MQINWTVQEVRKWGLVLLGVVLVCNSQVLKDRHDAGVRIEKRSAKAQEKIDSDLAIAADLKKRSDVAVDRAQSGACLTVVDKATGKSMPLVEGMPVTMPDGSQMDPKTIVCTPIIDGQFDSAQVNVIEGRSVLGAIARNRPLEVGTPSPSPSPSPSPPTANPAIDSNKYVVSGDT